jgi:xanthine dehydrogenase accessory factor
MSRTDIFEQIAALRREGRPFAVATVVARRAPVSAHLGDRAIVFADGRMEGFVGGACSHEIIRQQALEALKAGQARLVSIRPDASESRADSTEHVTVPMTCVSEGAVDVYVEPFVQARRLLVVGVTPVAEAIARLARSMDHDVVRIVDAREQRDIEPDAASIGASVVALDALAAVIDEGASRGLEQAAIVASQGHYDEDALQSLLRRGLPYIGLVASRKRAASVFAQLRESGTPGVDTIRNPAGLDLGARTPSEVALSILAEIVQARASVKTAIAVAAEPARATEPERALDPVCGMSVRIAGARHTAEVDGTTYYFCCANCRTRFLQDPAQFRAHA